MRIRMLVVPLAMLLSLSLIAPGATAAVRYTTSRSYFTCADDMPVQNVPIHSMNKYPSWSQARPTGVSLDEGCAAYANLGLHMYFSGTQRGPINSITVELHNAYVSRSRGHLLPMPLDVSLVVDGTPRVYRRVEIMPVASANGLTEVIRFTFTGLKVTGPGTHRIGMGVAVPWETQSLWTWGASEVPSGLTFNPRRAEAVRIPPG